MTVDCITGAPRHLIRSVLNETVLAAQQCPRFVGLYAYGSVNHGASEIGPARFPDQH